MSSWKRWLIMSALVLLAVFASAATAPPVSGVTTDDVFSDELGTRQYDVSLTLFPAKTLTVDSAIDLRLEWDGAKAYTRLTLTRKNIAIDAVREGRPTRIAQVEVAVTPGKPYKMQVLRRENWLALVQDSAIIFRGEVAGAPGGQAAVTAGAGWKVDEATAQRLEPVVFSDDFMRTPTEKGAWETISGEWALRSAWDDVPNKGMDRFTITQYAQNPFAWCGRSASGQALCMAGNNFWEDYTFTAAVCPSVNSTVGLAVNLVDGKNGIIARWSAANDRQPDGNMLGLYQVVNGVSTLLQKSPGGFMPGHWYKMAVVSTLEGVRVFIDGAERLSAKGVTPWRGAVGLYTSGAAGAVFDDISAYGRSAQTDLITEHRLAHINEKFQADAKMASWASASTAWLPFTGASASAGYVLHRSEFFGDQWMVATVKPTAESTGSLVLILNGDGRDITSGYRAVIQPGNAPGKISYTLYRGNTVLSAPKQGDALETDSDYTYRLWHIGNRIWLDEDGDTLLEATDPQPLTGVHPAFHADGIFAGARNVLVLSRNVLDYAFNDAPVDWIYEGSWMPTMRWSCAPQWSFLSGWNTGDAVLWHKQRFTGDINVKAFLGIKMEYQRQRAMYDDRYRNLAVSICTDGHNPRSGYTGIYGADSEVGRPNARSVIMRDGKVVASYPLTMPNRDNAHQTWFDLELRKHGATVEFWVNGTLILSYLDPNPLSGGVPAVWTLDNGISVARVSIHFAETPQLRTDAQVSIDNPAYPEWSNIEQAVMLDFPNACASTGNVLQFQVAAQRVPNGEQDEPVVADAKVTFTPKTVGEHWYTVTATDGKTTSPPFHVLLPVFNPALGRDDSHALVLYRFDEGSGNVVHDRSELAPAADLTLPKNEAVWQPGHGVTLTGASPMMTQQAVKKLNAITRQRQCTFEFWVSPDTLYPPPISRWIGCLLSYEGVGDRRNIAIGHKSYHAIVAPADAPLVQEDARNIYNTQFLLGLQHLTITWDGATTTIYENGAVTVQKNINWQVENWLAEAPLLLGNQGDGQRCFLGTYDLVAIYDRCFTPAQIQRHYQAGPSAR